VAGEDLQNNFLLSIMSLCLQQSKGKPHWRGFLQIHSEYRYSLAVLWIRIGFNAYPDPAFYLNANPDPDPGSETNANQCGPDPGQT
jgi:hypothetical protein